jgi:cell wall-associated NlpC family hydrolase
MVTAFAPCRPIDSVRRLLEVASMRKGFVRCRIAIVAALVAALASCATTPPAPVRHTPSFPEQHGHVDSNDILFRAIGLVGTPYRYGGNTPQGGFDCSGLVGYVFGDVAGIALPRSAEEISRINAPDVARDQLESGDIVYFRSGRHVSHVGIYVGQGRFVHAPNEGGTVRLDDLDAPYWRDHYGGAKRVAL